jgi:hypothetical protein
LRSCRAGQQAGGGLAEQQQGWRQQQQRRLSRHSAHSPAPTAQHRPGCGCPPRSQPCKGLPQSELQAVRAVRADRQGGQEGIYRGNRQGLGRLAAVTGSMGPQLLHCVFKGPRQSHLGLNCHWRARAEAAAARACDAADVAARGGAAAAGAQPGDVHVHDSLLTRLLLVLPLRRRLLLPAHRALRRGGALAAAARRRSRRRCGGGAGSSGGSDSGSSRGRGYRCRCLGWQAAVTAITRGNLLLLVLLLLLPPAQEALHQSRLEPVAGQLQPLALGAQVAHGQLGHSCLCELAPRRNALRLGSGGCVDSRRGGGRGMHRLATAVAAQRRGRGPPGSGPPAGQGRAARGSHACPDTWLPCASEPGRRRPHTHAAHRPPCCGAAQQAASTCNHLHCLCWPLAAGGRAFVVCVRVSLLAVCCLCSQTRQHCLQMSWAIHRYA